MGLAEMAPDGEAADHRPGASRAGDVLECFDEWSVHRWENKRAHRHTTSASAGPDSMVTHSSRISRPLAVVDRSSAATTG